MLDIEFNNFLPASNLMFEMRSLKCSGLKPSNPALLLREKDLKAARTSFGLLVGGSSNKEEGGRKSDEVGGCLRRRASMTSEVGLIIVSSDTTTRTAAETSSSINLALTRLHNCVFSSKAPENGFTGRASWCLVGEPDWRKTAMLLLIIGLKKSSA